MKKKSNQAIQPDPLPLKEEYRHPAFPQPDDSGADLWRYLDFEKFNWLVCNRRLFMASAVRLGDPLEGTRPDGDLKWWEGLLESAETDEKRNTIEYNRELLSSFAKAFRPNYYVSCWHMNSSEDKVMWRHYTKSPESVVIQTNYKVLRQSLPSCVEIGMVRYIDYATERLPTLNMFEYITHKSQEYEFEREVRAVALPPVVDGLGRSDFQESHFELESSPGFLIYAPPVQVRNFISSVVLHPEAEAGFEAKIADLCREAKLPAPTRSAFYRSD